MNLRQMIVLLFFVLFFGKGICVMFEDSLETRNIDDLRNEFFIRALVERMKYDNDMPYVEKKYKRSNNYPDMDLKREFASDQANPYI